MDARVSRLEAEVAELKRLVDSITGGGSALSEQPPPPSRPPLSRAKGVELIDGSEGRTIPFDPINDSVQRKITVKNVNCAVYFFYVSGRLTGATGFEGNKIPRKTPAIAVFMSPAKSEFMKLSKEELAKNGFEQAFYLHLDDYWTNIKKESMHNTREFEQLNQYLYKMQARSLKACISCGDVATLMHPITKDTFCSDEQCYK